MPNARVAPTGAEKTALKFPLWYSLAGLQSKHVCRALAGDGSPKSTLKGILREGGNIKYGAPALTCAGLLAKVYNIRQLQSIYFVKICSILQLRREAEVAYAGE